MPQILIYYKPNYIFFAPSFIGPPVLLLARRASNSFCLINFRSSLFFFASSNLQLVTFGCSSNGSNSVSPQLFVDFLLLTPCSCDSGIMGVISPGLHASDGLVNSASASFARKLHFTKYNKE
jgi:hypothetical protein